MTARSHGTIRNLITDSHPLRQDKNRSTDLDCVLKLQGIGWVSRKAISVSTMTLKITQETDADGCTIMTLEPALTGGLKGAPERRPLDWTQFEQNDTLFGLVRIRSRYIDGTVISDGQVRPLVELQIKDGGQDRESFLGGEFSIDTKHEVTGGIIKEAFLHDFVCSINSGWIAEQIWAVENTGEEKILTRRIVVVNGKSIQTARVIYNRQ
ncbi:hypothetical protein DPV78_005938 [Talaromyces pinophilus]|nr:hypothetical protein DPV78_005938 [Talaromyces pinophilus]